MSPQLASRARNLNASVTLQLARRSQELREAGHDVLSFGLGEPDFDTPLAARAAAHAAIDSGQTHYTANEGILPLRQAIAAVLREEQGLAYDPRTEILVTAGAKQALAHAILALVEEGDEVLVPSPYWVTYPELVRFAGGTVRFVPCDAANGFRLDPTALAAAVTPRTRLLILNSPANPTGAVLDPGRLAAIAEVVERADLAVVSDEIYGPLVHGTAVHRSIATVSPALRARTVICHGFSKAFAMTGWRLGYAAGPAPTVDAMNRIQSHTTSNASSISQHAGLGALREGRAEVPRMRAEFGARRDLVLARFAEIRGFELQPPEGAFYVFPRIAALYGRRTPRGAELRDSDSFCAALLDEALVSVLPGSAFGDDGCFRFSYAAARPQLEEGCRRIAEFVAALS